MIRDRKPPRSKVGNDERIPLLKATGYYALEIIQRQPSTDYRIFPYDPYSISSLFLKGRKKLGIEGLTFHDLRHEGASRLFEAGLALE